MKFILSTQAALLSSLLLSTVTASAQLQWDSRVLEFHPSPDQTNVVAAFPFKNAGQNPIRVLSVNTSCGCTTATPEKETYLPGETGQITATFTIGHRTGFQQKQITVTTDAPTNAVTQLTLNVRIPEIIKITPSFAFWRTHDPVTPKTMRIQVLENKVISIQAVFSTNPRFSAQLEIVQPGKEYLVTVSPHDTEKPDQTVLFFQSDSTNNARPSIKGFAYIKDPLKK